MPNNFSSNDASSLPLPPITTVSGRYHTSDDIGNIFGSNNILKWADLDNLRDAGTIMARLTQVIADSESWVDAKFQRSRYTIPFSSPCPAEIRRICCYISGATLYEPRQTEDISGEGTPPMKTLVMQKRKQADDMIRQILGNKLILNVPAANIIGSEAPQWVQTDSFHVNPSGSYRDELNLTALAQAQNPNFSDR